MLIIRKVCMAAIISSRETQVKIMMNNKIAVCFIKECFRGEKFSGTFTDDVTLLHKALHH